MPRRINSGGHVHTTKQKGTYGRRGMGIGPYSRRKKAAKADRYDRPYLTGNYSAKYDL